MGFFAVKTRKKGDCVEHIRNSSERCKYYNAQGGATMRLIDNVNTLLKDDLAEVLKKDSKVAIAAAYFSIYAYDELKTQLEQIDELKFLFTSPTFTAEKGKKELREFYIPQLSRERSLYGSEFEVKLRNELTQRAIAKECADWVRRKVTFKTNVTQGEMGGFVNVQSGEERHTYMPIKGFTTVELGSEKGNNIYTMINRLDSPMSTEYFRIFNDVWRDAEKMKDVTAEVIDSITSVYRENSPEFIYYITLYNIFSTFLDDVNEDVLPNEKTGFMDSAIWQKLYRFQKDAALAIINKLEQYNGCILADSVGLGKTFTALAVIKYYEGRNKSVLVLCPKKLSDNWQTFKLNLLNNPIASDRLRYDVLYHTDLSRTRGYSNGIPLDRLNWSNYDLVVIDESHNFRSGGQDVEDGERENRYSRLLNQVIRQGVKTKVLMLSATPVNNRFTDLRNQLALAYEGEEEQLESKLNIKSGIDAIFRRTQAAFNTWSQLDAHARTTETLLGMLEFDFFELLDSVTIARSRRHIERYYSLDEVGKFPERNEPISIRCELSDLPDVIEYNEIYRKLSALNLSVYSPTHYILASKLAEYEHRYGTDMQHTRFTQSDRESGVLVLMRTNLLKRLESSVYAFRLTVERILKQIEGTIDLIENFDASKTVEVGTLNEDDFDLDDQNTDLFSVGKSVQINLGDMDYVTWMRDLRHDHGILTSLLEGIRVITPEHDQKLERLLELIREKIRNPLNPGNKKLLIFSAFSDTVDYLYTNLSERVYKEYGLHSAMVTGSDGTKVTIPKFPRDFHTILTCFSPLSKDKHLIMPDEDATIDLLFATDCISEGQNLQDCDLLVNYDIHWNPVRIIQRFGRIDRIGSKNEVIQLVNFWPDLDLDDYINLKARVETRMKISIMTSTGDDNPIADDKGDLQYRKEQLKRLQNEVVDLEEMAGGVSIMDLGLNEFRMDLVSYIKDHPNLDRAPLGLHALVPSSAADLPPGVIYILKNINNELNIKNQNRIHPFYLVYIADDGHVIANHLEPKKTLDVLRHLCHGQTEPIIDLCRKFNEKTNDGRKMTTYSDLLQGAVTSIIDINEDSDLDSLFRPGGTTALRAQVGGLDDFELICFVVVM